MELISRQQAIDALVAETIYTEEELREYYEANSHRNEWVNGIYDAVEAIKQLPPIQPKRGKWHYSDGKPARIGMSFGVICDQCGTESEYCTNFCGECGADMRREVTT